MDVSSSDGVRLLVVDDNEDLVFTLSLFLKTAGYEVQSAATGEEALEKSRRWSPHCVLVDVKLPGISGLEVCHKLSELPNTPALIVMSGEKTDALDRAAGLRLGADDYMVKPVAGDELSARIEATLRRAVDARKRVALTKREIEVLELFASGSTLAEIARSLFISPKTVESHLENIRSKVGARSREETVQAAEALISGP